MAARLLRCIVRVTLMMTIVISGSACRTEHGTVPTTAAASKASFLSADRGKFYHYIAIDGDDTNPGTAERPFRTISRGVRALTPGHTLYITTGIYIEALIDVIPGGSSWASPVTVAALPGNSVILRPNPGIQWVLCIQGADRTYVIIDGLVLDGINVSMDAVKITSGLGTPEAAAHHIRLQNCTVMNAPLQGILVSSFAHSNEFIGLDVHDNGTSDLDHGFYIASSNNLIEQSRVHHNAGYGMQVYSSDPNAEPASYNVIRTNRVYDNNQSQSHGSGIILSSGEANIAYNNLI